MKQMKCCAAVVAFYAHHIVTCKRHLPILLQVLFPRRSALMIDPAPLQDHDRASKHHKDPQQFSHRQFLMKEKHTDHAAQNRHQQQIKLDKPYLKMPQIPVIEEIDPCLGKSAQRHKPPETRQVTD